jgi:hypothetical protein
VIAQLLRHRNIVPFLGVVRAAVDAPVRVVSLWMEYGPLPQYLAQDMNKSPLPHVRYDLCWSIGPLMLP